MEGMRDVNEPATMKGTGAYELYQGDSILVGMTHEISVGRDKSWIKYEATTKIRPGEVSDEARSRAIGHVNQSIVRLVETAVEQIRSHR
jgi:hypothetical protein